MTKPIHIIYATSLTQTAHALVQPTQESQKVLPAKVVLFIELKKLFMDVNIKINMNYTKNYVVRDYTLHNNAKTTFSLTFFTVYLHLYSI